MFEQIFKNLDDVLWKEAGCTTELDYTEQSSWMLFLKYLDDWEVERAKAAAMNGQPYRPVIDAAHRWSAWAAPKKNGQLDPSRALTGDDLIDFVNHDLFPYLRGFKQRAEGSGSVDDKIGEIFSEVINKFRSGYSLREALDLIDQLQFGKYDHKHELSVLYEDKIRRMGNAGRNGGEYYTPRPLIRAMIKVIDPRIGERVYDGAAGSAGFLCEAHDYMRCPNMGTEALTRLQTGTFYGQEKKSLAYIIAIMNMILHGIEAPNLIHTNSLAKNVNDIHDRFDVILANPPFGGKERREIQQNFPIRTGETAYLFLQHFIRSLKAGGRAAIIIKSTFLSNGDDAARTLRKELLQNCDLHSVLDLPGGIFPGSGVKTVVLFFTKGAPTRRLWFYQLDPGRSLGKTSPLTDEDFADFLSQQAKRAESERSWSVDLASLDQESWDLSPRNPHKADEAPLRSPQEIMADIAQLNAAHAAILARLQKQLEP